MNTNIPTITSIPNAEWETFAANDYRLWFSDSCMLELYIPTKKRVAPFVKICPYAKTGSGATYYTSAQIAIDLPNERDINKAKQNAITATIAYMNELAKNATLIADTLKSYNRQALA